MSEYVLLTQVFWGKKSIEPAGVISELLRDKVSLWAEVIEKQFLDKEA